jgi:hypothetical protein
MFGIVAAIAFARLSFSGVSAECDAAHTQKMHHHHPAHVATSGITSYHVNDASCADAANQAVCASMSACANALAPRQYASANIALIDAAASSQTVERFVNPSSAPEPPPPRA